MSGDRGVSFPVAALGMAALLLSSALLSHHGFDLLRLSESDVVKQRPLAQPPVEARLWEDPLAATVRHRGRLKEICPPGATNPDPRCPRDGTDRGELPSDVTQDPGNLTVIAALVPGASYMGVEEARRRIRYAVLAGLTAEGFVPDNSELMGLLKVPVCAQFAGCKDTSTKMDVPYETFSNASRRVAVLWIDDFAIGKEWMSTLAVMLTTVAPPDTGRLRVLGPHTSGKLVDALNNLASPHSQLMIDFLNRLELISPFATAPADQLLTRKEHSAICPKPRASDVKAGVGAGEADKNKAPDCIDTAFKDRLKRAKANDAPFFVRTIGTDDVQIKLLKRELCARGLGDGRGGRVILLSEWDSIYARSFVRTLGSELDCRSEELQREPLPKDYLPTKYEIYSYLQGLDGATIDGASKQQRLVPRSADDSKGRDGKKDPDIEWPENRDQRDYVRRLVDRLQDEAQANPKKLVRAVGIIGVDVHDKLILAQALRPAFPERMLFTTDLDARLLHPNVAKYTRNLIVSSSLPLSPSDLDPPMPSEIKVAPFRDVYQTAIFLGTRYASTAASSKDCDQACTDKKLRQTIASQLTKERLYEIGRRSEVRLGVDKQPSDDNDRLFYAVLSFVVLLGFGVLMTYGRPGPAMKLALSGEDPFRLSTMIVSGLTVAAWGFALGVVAELALPGHVGPQRAIVLAATLVILFWMAIYPGQPGRRTAWLRIGCMAVLSVVGAWCFLQVQADHADMREPFALLSGVSGWPSQLLRTLAVLLFGWFVDYTWNGSRQATDDIGTDYFGVKAEQEQSPVASGAGIIHRTVTALQDMSLWFWQPKVERRGMTPDEARRHGLVDDGGIDGARLWRSYLCLLLNGRRFRRTVFWLVLVGIFVWAEMKVFGGDLPEVPARGLDDRALFLITIFVSVFGTITLMVMVSDATILTWRFIQVLKNLRTVYPEATVERFAAELGPDMVTDEAKVSLWVAARVHERGAVGRTARNSLLDDWIDARLLADHTAAIAPLIFFPFTLLGLLIIARSPMFDNWAVAGPVLVVLTTYLLWTIAMATMLNFAAETARRKALESMRKDLLWLQGAGATYKLLAEHFPSLIKQVEDLRKGAFAPFFEQPLVRAVLVPLGGVGGIQLLDMLAFARP